MRSLSGEKPERRAGILDEACCTRTGQLNPTSTNTVHKSLITFNKLFF